MCTPLEWQPFLEKHPLYFATVELFYHILGTHPEGIGRLASVVFSLGTLAVVFFGIRTLMGEEVSGLSTLILATSFLFFSTSHKMLVDNALVFFTTSALASFMLGYKEKSSWGFKLFWVCLSLAFMTKGAVGIGIPIIAVVSFMLWKMDFSVLKKMWLVPGVFLVAVIIATWMQGVTSHEISRLEKIFLWFVTTAIIVAGIVMPTLFVYMWAAL